MDPATLAAFLDRYGLPIVILFGLGFTLVKRILVLGSELDRAVTVYEKDLAYRDARRIEERDGRLAAEAALRDLSTAVTKLGNSVEELTETVTRARG